MNPVLQLSCQIYNSDINCVKRGEIKTHKRISEGERWYLREHGELSHRKEWQRETGESWSSM